MKAIPDQSEVPKKHVRGYFRDGVLDSTQRLISNLFKTFPERLLGLSGASDRIALCLVAKKTLANFSSDTGDSAFSFGVFTTLVQSVRSLGAAP